MPSENEEDMRLLGQNHQHQLCFRPSTELLLFGKEECSESFHKLGCQLPVGGKLV